MLRSIATFGCPEVLSRFADPSHHHRVIEDVYIQRCVKATVTHKVDISTEDCGEGLFESQEVEEFDTLWRVDEGIETGGSLTRPILAEVGRLSSVGRASHS